MPTGATTSSSSSTGRTRSSTRPPGATPTSTTPRSTSAARRTRAWAATTPWAPRRAPAGCEDDSERPRPPRKRSRGSRSRAAGASCSRRSTTARPARPQDAVDRADRVVGRLALAELRGADRRDVRDRSDGLLLHGVEKGSAGLTGLVRDPPTTLITIGSCSCCSSRWSDARPGVPPFRFAWRAGAGGGGS